MWKSYFHLVLTIWCHSIACRCIKWTKCRTLLCCGLVCQPRAHWLVCAQPLFLSVNSLDHSTPESSSSFSSSTFFYGPHLAAESQYLGRIPTCYHNHPLMHEEIFKASSSNAKFTNLLLLSKKGFLVYLKCYTLFFTPYSDRYIILVSSPTSLDHPSAC